MAFHLARRQLAADLLRRWADVGKVRSPDSHLLKETQDFLCDASGGPFTIILPAASGLSGTECCIKKTDPSDNVVTISANASEIITQA